MLYMHVFYVTPYASSTGGTKCNIIVLVENCGSVEYPGVRGMNDSPVGVTSGKNWSQVLSCKSPKCTSAQWVVTVCGLYSAAEHAVAATTVVYLLLPLQWSRNS